MSDHRTADVLAHHETHPGGRRAPPWANKGRRRRAVQHEGGRAETSTASRGLREVATRAHPVGGRQHGGDQAARRLRPLRRRADRIERPARVRIRNRKPWVLARRRVFGWKVRLLTGNAPEAQVEAAAHRPAQTVGLRTPPDAGEGRRGGCAGMRQCPKIAQQPHCGRPTVRSRSTRGQTGRAPGAHGQPLSLPARGWAPAATHRSHEAGCGQPLDGGRWKWVPSARQSGPVPRPASPPHLVESHVDQPPGAKGWLARKW